MGYILAWLFFLSFFAAFAAMLGMMLFCVSRWLLEKGGWTVRSALLLVQAALGAALIYGCLRLTGLLRFPTDHSFSCNLFGTSWLDEGFGLLWKCGGPFAGVAWAFAERRKQYGKGEQTNGKQPD